jgi:hypothetical protein
MARGTILAWLNSDDLYLPGAIRNAVDAFQRNPSAGAVYGEGYLIDRSGQSSCRFPYSEAFNLWKLVHLSDYILQQTVYFRKDVLDEIGFLDEQLHYTMDWDVLIRIGMKYPLEYIPEYMGCLREYPEAKSFAGGALRIREIRDLLRRHTGMRIPHGYIVYGLDSYHRMWSERVARLFAPKLKPVSDLVQYVIRCGAGLLIGRTIRESQGLYSDRWASRLLRYMLPPGEGALVVEGSLPKLGALWAQELHISANGQSLGQFSLPFGDFSLSVEAPPALQGQLLHLTIKASRWFAPGRFTLRGDRRRLAYKLKSIRWEKASEAANTSTRPALAGC